MSGSRSTVTAVAAALLAAAAAPAPAAAGAALQPPNVGESGLWPPKHDVRRRATAADEAERLAKARERWAARAVRSYRFRLAVACFCAHRSPVTIRVRDGKPRGTPHRFREFDTVEELFARIDEELDRGGDPRARYARRTGVPRQFDADPLPRAIDDEYAVTVRRFRVVR